jgi:hypothetical protein
MRRLGEEKKRNAVAQRLVTQGAHLHPVARHEWCAAEREDGRKDPSTRIIDQNQSTTVGVAYSLPLVPKDVLLSHLLLPMAIKEEIIIS